MKKNIKNILYNNEVQYYLSPVPFGCKPCPNGCINPEKGKQCCCEEYDKIVDRWMKDFPLEYAKYIEAENLFIDLYEDSPESIFDSKKCPLCNKK